MVLVDVASAVGIHYGDNQVLVVNAVNHSKSTSPGGMPIRHGRI